MRFEERERELIEEHGAAMRRLAAVPSPAKMAELVPHYMAAKRAQVALVELRRTRRDDDTRLPKEG